MAIMRYPARRLLDLPDLFGLDTFNAPTRQMLASEPTMRVEQFRENGDIVVRAEMPGLNVDEDVDITIEDDVIHIAAERREEKTEDKEGTYRSEFRYGRFERSFRLPKDADAEKIKADYNKGILEIRIPVAAAVDEEPRKVSISSKE